MEIAETPREKIIDTRFRSALARLIALGRTCTVNRPVNVELDLAAVMKKFDGGPALLFPHVNGFNMPVVGNLLSCRENCEAAFDLDFRGIRQLVDRALGNPLPPERTEGAPVHETVITSKIDLPATLPALHHASADAGRFITAGIVVVRDPETGVYNASYHRLQLIGPDRTAIKLDYGRHLRLAFERASRQKSRLPVAVCIGTDLALQFTAATMGSQMPESADELAVAGSLSGRALPVTGCVTQDLLVPAETEIVLEGELLPDETVEEGPFGEFVGFLSPPGPAPILQITALTQRRDPIYHAINGYGRETIMLRKYVLETTLLKVLRAASPIVTDVEMTSGGLYRFHAVIQVDKRSPQHDGLQRNAALAAFGALKDLDLVVVVDADINIRDPDDVEYALATRFEASKDLIVVPGARGHEYVRASKEGVRAKLCMDATVPFDQHARFQRCTFAPCVVEGADLRPGIAGDLPLSESA